MVMEHVGIVTANMQEMLDFYLKYFEGKPYHWKENGTDYELYFINFPSGSRLELQKCQSDLPSGVNNQGAIGLAHIAFQVETKEELHALTERMLQDGVSPRTPPTAYGTEFYESSFFDPDGNIVELAVNQANL